MMNQDQISQVMAFLEAFEEVFDLDWLYTKEMLGISNETEQQKAAAAEMGLDSIPIISEDGNFLEPGVEDEIEDWGARGALLKKYRSLKLMMTDLT